MEHLVGEHVGSTTSGKPIMAFLRSEDLNFPHPSAIDFTLRDQFEAFLAFQYLCIRTDRKSGKISDDYFRYNKHALYYQTRDGILENFDELRVAVGSFDAFGDFEVGRKLCRPEYWDI